MSIGVDTTSHLADLRTARQVSNTSGWTPSVVGVASNASYFQKLAGGDPIQNLASRKTPKDEASDAVFAPVLGC